MTPQGGIGPVSDLFSVFAQDLQSIIGTIQFGRDASGNFAMSLEGLAVRRSDGSFVILDDDGQELIDVTTFVLAELDPGVVRVPTRVAALRRGDVIIVSDAPFSALFVLDHDGRRIRGLDAATGDVTGFVPPINFPLNFTVRAACLFDLLRNKGRRTAA